MPGLSSKILRYGGAAGRAFTGYRDNQLRRSQVLQGMQNTTEDRARDEGNRKNQELLSQQVGAYATALQQQNPEEANRKFDELMRNPTMSPEAKTQLSSQHQVYIKKLQNPPHPSGMTAKEVADLQRNTRRDGMDSTYDPARGEWSFSPLPPDQLSYPARTRADYEAAQADRIRTELETAATVNIKTDNTFSAWEKEFNDEYRKRYVTRDGDIREDAPDQDDWVNRKIYARAKRYNLLGNAGSYAPPPPAPPPPGYATPPARAGQGQTAPGLQGAPGQAAPGQAASSQSLQGSPPRDQEHLVQLYERAQARGGDTAARFLQALPPAERALLEAYLEQASSQPTTQLLAQPSLRPSGGRVQQ